MAVGTLTNFATLDADRNRPPLPPSYTPPLPPPHYHRARSSCRDGSLPIGGVSADTGTHEREQGESHITPTTAAVSQPQTAELLLLLLLLLLLQDFRHATCWQNAWAVQRATTWYIEQPGGIYPNSGASWLHTPAGQLFRWDEDGKKKLLSRIPRHIRSGRSSRWVHLLLFLGNTLIKNFAEGCIFFNWLANTYKILQLTICCHQLWSKNCWTICSSHHATSCCEHEQTSREKKSYTTSIKKPLPAYFNGPINSTRECTARWIPMKEVLFCCMLLQVFSLRLNKNCQKNGSKPAFLPNILQYYTKSPLKLQSPWSKDAIAVRLLRLYSLFHHWTKKWLLQPWWLFPVSRPHWIKSLTKVKRLLGWMFCLDEISEKFAVLLPYIYIYIYSL